MFRPASSQKKKKKEDKIEAMRAGKDKLNTWI
jgi:hypothetical protein